ncbi:MAG: hemin ABC transporter substrate-binding protein [Sphingobacteriales bacterium]|nr:MAG: hemin ABC transporter substrate-binding protein [Sphingobacteriales bacterium]
MNFKIKAIKILSPLLIILFISTLAKAQTGKNSLKIVSLNGTLSEIIVSLGLQANLVGVDITSTYPASLNKLPKVGHNRNLSAEGILALQPNLIIGIAKDIKPELAQQFKSAGIKMMLFNQDFSFSGTQKLVLAVADSLKQSHKASAIINKIEKDMATAKPFIKPNIKPKILFIYARGTGTMMVAGNGTQVQKMVQLAGGQNATTGFKDFKPLTAESLVLANPDVILLFDTGLESLGGANGLQNVPGIAQTNAGKNKRIIVMDGQLLCGFGPRLGLAVAELAKKLNTK